MPNICRTCVFFYSCILNQTKMKTIQIASIVSIVFDFIGCEVSEDTNFKTDLFAFGLMCLFVLIYSSHLVGLQNKKKDEK